jgi:hypothetical protein
MNRSGGWVQRYGTSLTSPLGYRGSLSRNGHVVRIADKLAAVVVCTDMRPRHGARSGHRAAGRIPPANQPHFVRVTRAATLTIAAPQAIDASSFFHFATPSSGVIPHHPRALSGHGITDRFLGSLAATVQLPVHGARAMPAVCQFGALNHGELTRRDQSRLPVPEHVAGVCRTL